MGRLCDISYDDPRWRAMGLDAIAETAARAALSELNLNPAQYEISVLACDDDRIATLNADFRGKPAATNVLSWPSGDRGAERAGDAPDLADLDPELGDIAISYDTCAREAVQQDKPISAHVTHLIVHAVLHLLGYDHIRDKDAALMEGLEVSILASLGVSDPYSLPLA